MDKKAPQRLKNVKEFNIALILGMNEKSYVSIVYVLGLKKERIIKKIIVNDKPKIALKL